ncbi:DUF2243 domain-containing protein [Halocatena marina]|uniref:DUF2243 domain-containing protein n=1 Tax=Halocatena marina TaxID=2934937 RepID=UPI00200F18E3|nr:DUF2243 domain-containing protein [Halocatena marina]
MDRQERQRPNRSREAATNVPARALFAAGIFGFGFSGLIDVIVLHHILQWHHLVSAIYPMTTLSGLRMNIFADGLFSIGMILVMGIGGGLVWRSERRTSVPLAFRPLAGAAVIGLGVFDLFDVVVNHAVLGLHHAVSRGGRYDPHWAIVSIGIILVGVYVYRTGLKNERGAVDNS